MTVVVRNSCHVHHQFVIAVAVQIAGRSITRRIFFMCGFKTKPYDIPLRALIAKDVDGLMMAGRCISGDFTAHASYRVTGNAVAMGEAAGRVSALAARSGRLPHEVPWNEAKGSTTKP